jgi:Fe-S-cluster containining protein
LKKIDVDNLEALSGQLLREGETFSFRCHPALACFNRCCRNLNLFLYPYDVIRLKNRLGLSSDQFLEKHVHVVLRETNYFPEVLLKLSENAEKTCPFLSTSGCTVYTDRPDTCRTFPVEQGLYYSAERKTPREISLFRPPDFCLGQHEDALWTVESWLEDQQAGVYHRMTVKWSKVKGLFQSNPWGAEGPRGRKAKMAFMAAYNVDRFRAFLFESSFLERYRLDRRVLKAIRADEVALMEFGLEWLKLVVWGIRSRHIRLRRP